MEAGDSHSTFVDCYREEVQSARERESNGVYTGIVTKRMYLQGTTFKVVIDHKPLVPLYNGESRPKQPRVDRHLMKLV